MATRPTPLRRVRERELVDATRALFDERGMQEAPIEEIARSVGIARGLIYRQFASKEELFVATVTSYLYELRDVLREAIPADASPAEKLERCSEAYASYCQRYPAFLDCALSLMRRPASDLREVVSEAVYVRLGQGMADTIDQLAAILREGAASGDFRVEDPDYTANVLWTQALGLMHLARIRVGVRKADAGVAGLFEVSPDRVVATCVEGALTAVGARRASAQRRRGG